MNVLTGACSNAEIEKTWAMPKLQIAILDEWLASRVPGLESGIIRV